MFIEFGAARLADGFENAGSRRRAAKGGWLQPAHGSHPVRWQIGLKNQTAGAVVQRQNIAKSDGADGKAGASRPPHHGRAALGPDRHAAAGADLRGKRLHLTSGGFDRVDSSEGADADAQRCGAEIVTAACGVLYHQSLPHEALHVTMRGGATGAGAFSKFAKRKPRIGSGEKIKKPRRNRYGLNKRRALFTFVFRPFFGFVIHGVQGRAPLFRECLTHCDENRNGCLQPFQ